MEVYGITDIGQKRTNNQDYIFYSGEKIGNLPNLFIVADGMGGHNAGDQASSIAVKNFIEFVDNTDLYSITDILKIGIKEMNSIVYKLSMENEEFTGMGTTFVVAVIDYGTLYVANIGDSRAYIVNEENINKVTIDHSFVEEMLISGQITEEEAINHPKKNRITRAIGVSDTVMVDLFEQKLNSNDYVLMCSDGLTNMLSNNEIKEILLSNTDVEEKVKNLISASNCNGGDDNISAIVIKN
ncbi:MAG: Serine/threonine protein phosphatase [Clostridiales bacterium]|nr:Serine/threonine protein phosphatase [Clostridiales bacterium]